MENSTLGGIVLLLSWELRGRRLAQNLAALAPPGILSRLMQHTNANKSGERGRATRGALDFCKWLDNFPGMKKLLLAFLIATPAAAQSPEWFSVMEANGVKRGCYVTGFTDKPVTLCQGQQGWNPEVQQLFQSFGVAELYTNSFGVSRTLLDDLKDNLGFGPWVRNFVLKEYERRGVKL